MPNKNNFNKKHDRLGKDAEEPESKDGNDHELRRKRPTEKETTDAAARHRAGAGGSPGHNAMGWSRKALEKEWFDPAEGKPLQARGRKATGGTARNGHGPWVETISTRNTTGWARTPKSRNPRMETTMN
jgi:hypothetical protein